MKDEMDVYLRNGLKNWVSRYNPPVDGRQKLLQAAASEPQEKESRFFSFILSILNYDRFSNQLTLHQQNEWVVNTATQTFYWSARLSSSWRLLH